MKRLLPLLVLVALSQPASATGDVLWFEDNFDGAAPDTTVWFIDEGDGSVYVQDGWLYLETEGPQVYFPFMYSREDPFPTGDLMCEIRAQYLAVFQFGNGHGCCDSVSGGHTVWGVWQGATTRLLVNVFGTFVYQSPEVDVDVHEHTFELLGTTGTAFMDGDVLGSETSLLRPHRLTLGHNPETVPGWPSEWTRFRVDYIRVWQLGPTAVDEPLSTWSRIKTQFR